LTENSVIIRIENNKGVLKMTENRKNQLFDAMLNHITELVSDCDLKLTLEAMGFTEEEMLDCGIVIAE
jgi:hypothetical protein